MVDMVGVRSNYKDNHTKQDLTCVFTCIFVRAPGGYGPHKAARKAEADGTDDDRRQAYDENRFPSDHVSRVTPNVAAHESAKCERACHVAGGVPCCKKHPRTTAVTVSAVKEPPTRHSVLNPRAFGSVVKTNSVPTVAWAVEIHTSLNLLALAQVFDRYFVWRGIGSK